MRLFKIHVSGFKSFVDPTSILISGDLVGIVGPNGCGKSNVIDAVRWVMGESSARNLRGDNMTDVIFNGTDSRKPVGQASVELIFDNTEGKAPGNYASFAEISVKRTLSRDGASEYLINRSRCRRRDITDMFRGTGLGHRSYSIIEQGMVSRIVEARPEELRNFVEEAAGVSIYKDRRRETETRIRHTRENLARVEDIRSELAGQLRKLQRQSQAARRYQRLKDQERKINGELFALRYLSHQKMIEGQSRETNEAEITCESVMSKQTSIELLIEETLAGQLASQELVSEIQGQIYSLGADIATIEQSIEHSRETEHQQRGELDRLRDSLSDLKQQHSDDLQSLNGLELELGQLEESRTTLQKAFSSAEQALSLSENELNAWQEKWGEFTRRAAEPAQQQEVERNRIEQFESRDKGLQHRLARIDEEDEGLLEEEESLDIDAIGAEIVESERVLSVLGEKIQSELDTLEANRQKSRQVRQTLDEERRLLHEITGRIKPLSEMQSAALDTDDEGTQAWFRARGLSNAPRLAAEIQVSTGWEVAADAILGDRLAGLGVGQLDRVLSSGQELPSVNLFLIESVSEGTEHLNDKMLLGRVYSARYDLRPWLAGVYVADTLEEALSRREALEDQESIVTRSGVVVGKNWIYAPNAANIQGGILARGEELYQLESQKSNHESQIKALDEQLTKFETEVVTAENRRNHLQLETEGVRNTLSEKQQVSAAKEARAAQIHARSGQLRVEGDELIRELSDIEGQLTEARRNLALAEDETGSLERNRELLLKERDSLTEALGKARDYVHYQRDQLHSAELEMQRLQVSVDSTRSTMERLSVQSKRIEEHQKRLEAALARGEKPELDYKNALEQLLSEKNEVDGRLGVARENYVAKEEVLRAQRAQLSECEQELATSRGVLESRRLKESESTVRLEALIEQIKVDSFSIDEILESTPPEANEAEWKEKAEQLGDKIQQIGPVNLVAIDEYDEQLRRKEYLDGQHEDLAEALEMLEGVIKKIDRETKERFKRTFDLLNEGFGDFFPQLFGGGKAVLQLTDNDLLRSGVTVMAQPPGKRNSTIHLLSGGEKALTAVALLFALFRLNPAPFCILDEVDAPLDDSNVERYCSTLRSLAARTQLIVITHNKITMESADVLLGVTMGEPGASAIVSVDVEEAVNMANV